MIEVCLTVVGDALRVETIPSVGGGSRLTRIGPGWIGSREGYILRDTGERLAASDEALAWLRLVEPTDQLVNDVMCTIDTFAWIGAPTCLIPRSAKGQNRYAVFNKCQLIPNAVKS